jgi:hypothetical protein
MGYLKLIVNIFSIALILILSNTLMKNVHASYLISYDFNNQNVMGWNPINISGANTSDLWHISNGTYGINTNRISGIGTNTFGSEDWTDYTYEVDVFPISIVDTNIIFRYTNVNGYERYYEIHGYSGGDMNLSEYHGVLDKQYKIPFWMNPNKGYRFRIEAIGSNIKVYYKELGTDEFVLIFDVTDNTPLLKGKVGLKIALKNSGITTIYFDNITLTDLSTPTPTPTPTPTSTPTPTPTPFPYFSQIDPQWKDVAYDHVNSTIGKIGCALTSAAMVLKSYGLDKVPVGDMLEELNPKTLNVWLNSDPSHKRWGRNGALNWLALTELARDLHASSASEYTKLEFDIYDGDDQYFYPSINTLLTDNFTPLIFKEKQNVSSSGKHFYVASNVEVSESNSEPVYTYTVHDPYNQSRNSVDSSTNKVQAAYQYFPT